ncbi:MAG TPA: hypothetical protein VH518_16490 [Tepidisphaeraceae bacterium]|jgi:hypothetical protein
MSILDRLIGPRIPGDELKRHWLRYTMPTVTLSVARVLLLVSLFLPYWNMTLQAPQYPKGLHLQAFVNRVEGHVREIDGLNHYIGMRPLGDAAKLEKAVAIWSIIAMVLLVEGASFIHTRWAVLLVLPAVLFPLGFLVDLHYWLALFGQNLDPRAPLSSSVKPFVPPVLGEGVIGQFKTIASMGIGLWLAWACAGLSLVALAFHRLAYKPLFDRFVREQTSRNVTVCPA